MTQAYSITINLPIELQESLQPIVNNYMKHNDILHKPHIQSYEQCHDGKLHAHIGYLSDSQKTTSNETRKYKQCYPFKKKQHPNAILHVKHSDWNLLVGYVSKDSDNNELVTNLPLDFVDQRRTEYHKLKASLKTKTKNNKLTVNDIVDQLVKYIEKDSISTTNYVRHHKNQTVSRLISAFLNTIKDQILFTTYQKINIQRLEDYLKFKIDTSKYYI